ncbi:single-stranded-DNA-specific exonuclease RecJ [candidate division WOR-1 bacterium RIFOXYC2_FULL_37_10]|uniref:Single-stranded-DNA-specific exonuclease RecJ n=1 Tax=candidate division WOR-1 bacterium RIFOXYB2_FULL_37_13 TaxID=1802579 RepID=A0A1F4SWC0_UNCSA|nr:MAG: single-stranded-DNA-specific exonuclease RecJ [candidate division WOR-1 bacterium RIFOXYA2_FULL_37_7]OGC24748.1 MAG: single-stranded-DNA-specific exonuclease RecJ [candidate division WOR-1 bacterium RIFOXYB2_FULL_37_13]OGC34792.1 MAG: single-stranded-DNA-specific exonuclease RecJ [candidate division WOR-1 bacterium RIFOXYC2_FULL_37_10]
MKRWDLLPPNDEISRTLSKELNISPITAQILINRKILDPKNAQEFLSPRLMNLNDPFNIPDIKKGAERIILAKQRGEKVVVYGDYDVDGVTGTAILLETLKHIGMNPSYYIPYRYGEGYSLNIGAVKKLKEEGTNLIITVDCGISSFLEIEEANSLGMEVIVTDHHNIPKELPNAYAIINPKLIKEENTSRNLSGAGVAFKFAWGLLRTLGNNENGFLTSLLDLAALGTIADVVPLTGENRILAKKGLEVLKERKRLGIAALALAAGLKEDLSIRDINFGLAPRINAAGRLEHASLAVNLLISKEAFEAETLAKQLHGINIKRQEIGEIMNKEISLKIKEADIAKEKIIVMSGENWHAGVIGIIASRIVEKYYRPVVLISINEGLGRGSARSIDGFNVFNLLDSCRDLFIDFGGHAAAAGFAIEPMKIPELQKRLAEALLTLDIDFTPRITIDALLNPEQATLGLVEELALLGPYGQDNPSPIFISSDLHPIDIKSVGNDGAHLKIKFIGKNSATVDAIGFGLGKLKDSINLNSNCDIVYSLERNLWNGFESVQFNLVDVKEH